MAFIKTENRNVVPRWRTFRDTLALGELGSGSDTPLELRVPTEDWLAERKHAWEHHRTVWHAADLLSAGVGLRRVSEVQDAALFLASHKQAPSPARDLARKVLGRSPRVTYSGDMREDLEEIQDQIHSRRVQLSDDPRNAILWVDLALFYTVQGLRKQAARAMAIATSLNHSNRFIVRSAARFYLHTDDAERAHDLLRRAPAVRRDPWLMSAEIAVALAARRSPRLVDAGRKCLDDAALRPGDTSELASALATVEHVNGKDRIAKKLFRYALDSPNENSLAQVEWASERITGLSVNVSEFNVPCNFEAKALEYFSHGEWDAAYENARRWLTDQPFAASPAILSSYIASSILERHDESVEILERSLQSNPNNATVVNNLAFAYASLGQTDAAQRALHLVNVEKLEADDKLAIIATQGLIDYRNGFIDIGRERYKEAMEIAAASGNKRKFVEAMIFMAREEIHARTALASETAEFAMRESVGISEKYIQEQVKRLRSHLDRRDSPAAAAG